MYVIGVADIAVCCLILFLVIGMNLILKLMKRQAMKYTVEHSICAFLKHLAVLFPGNASRKGQETISKRTIKRLLTFTLNVLLVRIDFFCSSCKNYLG